MVVDDEALSSVPPEELGEEGAPAEDDAERLPVASLALALGDAGAPDEALVGSILGKVLSLPPQDDVRKAYRRRAGWRCRSARPRG